MNRNTFLSMCAFALCLSLLLCVSMSAQTNNAAQTGVITQADFNRAANFAVTPPLRDLINSQPVSPFGFHEASPVLRPKLMKQRQFAAERGVATASTNASVAGQISTSVPATVGVNVLGVGVGFQGYTVPDAPTDSNGASGDWPGNQANAQVVEWVNVSYAVFRKSDGAYLAGPILGQTLWSSLTGSQCATHNSGDIIVQFDKLAHRWLLFQPVFSQPYAGCFAISTSPDALGSYFLYDFPMAANRFPDYPKLAIQPDAYYQSQNIFNNRGTAFLGVTPCAYNRVKMLAGDPTAEQWCTFDNSGGSLFDDGFLPADLDTTSLPLPPFTPEVYLGSIDNHASETNVYLYTYALNPTNPWTVPPVLSGINGANPLQVTNPTVGPPLPAYVGLCGFGGACITQLGVPDLLDSLGDRLMFRIALHTVNNANVPVTSYLVSHSIDNNGTGAERWYEFRAPRNNPTALSFYQGGIYAPDSTYRWMGSIAMDKMGNIALGYSRSSATLHPDIYFTGRLSSDAPGTMGGELPIVDQSVATGSQPDTNSRWGDYSSMTLDLDGCTLWYVNQYYTTTVRFNWSTRVASLKFNNCTPTPLH